MRINDVTRAPQTAVALLFSVSTSAVRQWQECPRNDDKTYDLPAVVAWRLDQIEHDGAVAVARGEAAERFRAAKADLAELDLAERRGELISVTDMDAFATRLVALVRSVAEQVQRKYGPESLSLFEKARDQMEKEIETAKIGG